MKSIEHFLQFFNCDTAEKVVLKLLSIDELNIEDQHLVINAFDLIDSELNEQMLCHSTIWDQLIRCYGKQVDLSRISVDVSEKPSLLSELSVMKRNLENYHVRLQRDNITLHNEQLLMEQLFLSQREISSFLDKIHLGLSEWLASSKAVPGEKRNLVENSLLYTLQLKQGELKLQSMITDQGIKNLELIQNNNKALLTRISDLLANSLGSLITSYKMFYLINNRQV
ncbi:MAG: hypothetical protein L3J59_02125 [Methylococcaceae bacterium]|nr:hypothetical protein [Methylococcaceae bacterium]